MIITGALIGGAWSGLRLLTLSFKKVLRGNLERLGPGDGDLLDTIGLLLLDHLFLDR